MAGTNFVRNKHEFRRSGNPTHITYTDSVYVNFRHDYFLNLYTD